MPHFSIILPCYNEAATLPSLFSRFSQVIGARTDLEVIFVNNGSKDNSSEIIATELTRPDRAFARMVNVPVNRGYGYGILAGLKEATGDYIGWTHADSQYDPRIVLDGFDRLMAADDGSSQYFLRGRRVRRNLFDAAFTAAMTAVTAVMLGTFIPDANAQPKLFPRSFLDQMRAPPWDFSLDLYALFLAKKRHYQILELPVVFERRLHGEAKGGGSFALKWKLSKRTLVFMRQLRTRVRKERT